MWYLDRQYWKKLLQPLVRAPADSPCDSCSLAQGKRAPGAELSSVHRTGGLPSDLPNVISDLKAT
eukprot:1817368-Prorocentrum_lima.AAC.1